MHEREIYRNIPRRVADSHKGDYGRVLIVSGSRNYVGAPFFAASAAVNTGSGLVYLMTPDVIYPIVAHKLNEPIFLPVPSDENGKITEAALPTILKQKKDVCLFGPGLGQSRAVSDLARECVRSLDCPVVLDADGLNAIAKTPEVLKEAKAPIVLTPHVGEFSRLFPAFSERRRVEDALSFAKEYQVIVVLKGHRTITALPDGRLFENTTGNPGMAKGGSGDVLSGMIASLIGQGISPEIAAYTAVWLHGRAGDVCKKLIGEYGMTPTDMLSAIKTVLRDC
ncbi:MAG: NAD(P)H-hydrate dehydratase [Ruminococcaceae bacterium]|nr:NAD(P)H-hydrate dehydratase [Oscillospiraceae bacterium]